MGDCESTRETGETAFILVDLSPECDGSQYRVVAGQRGATVNRATETADTTTKDSDGWQENEPTIRNWSVDFDGLEVENDEGLSHLNEHWRKNKKVKVRVLNSGGDAEEGLAVITSLTEEKPHDGEKTYSATVTGSGPLTPVPGSAVA